MNVRSFDSVVDEARLVASPSESVVRYLEDRGMRLAKKPFSDTTDEQLEQALLERHDRLIDLALARWCCHIATGRALLAANTDDSTQALAIRLSLLSNVTAGASFMSNGPTAFFGESPMEWFPSASDEELTAFFANPSLNNQFFEAFFNGGPSWACLSEPQRLTALRALTRNPRMSTPYDQSFADGYAEYTHNKVFEAAWNMAGTLPNTRAWAFVLAWLFDVLLPIGHGVEDPLALAARWNPEDDEGVKHGSLSPFQHVRKGLARLALAKNPKRVEEFLASDDPALRAAVYATRRLNAEQITAAVERDGAMGFDEMVRNDQLWRNQDDRDALRAASWAVVQADPSSDLLPHNLFTGMWERMEKEHPSWFADVAPADPDNLDVPATRGDVQRVLETLSGSDTTTGLQQVALAIQTLNKRLGWVWWFSLGALVASVAHRL
ncbi:TPA: hypothetical protein QDB35_000021 [Burkholderia vietnamiensis]|nr:hypothetical protein [Burkholderia vietnamiensis]